MMSTHALQRWERIRELLTQKEAALIFNACQDKARGDREAALTLGANKNEAGSTLAKTLLEQADLADDIAEQVLA